jgi:hypothetical protein
MRQVKGVVDAGMRRHDGRGRWHREEKFLPLPARGSFFSKTKRLLAFLGGGIRRHEIK